ncbi:MAG: LPS-assembly protein LptD [Alphaproteobacteria bacterium]
MNKFIICILIIILMFRQIIYANSDNNTYINSSNIKYDEKNNIVELSKNSKINIDNTNILVDRGIIDYNQDTFQVFGNFYLYQELNILSGKDLNGDTRLINFTANNVSYIYNNDLKIDSDKAERSENIIFFYNNYLTPCELEGYFNCPTWSLRIDETKYDIERDKYIHYDTFLQIADYKLFYLPYFSHYGAKAPRQKGFLTPSLQFVIGGDSGIKVPYYLPLNINTDIVFTPTLYLDQNFQFLETYKLNTKVAQRSSGGLTEITVDNIKNNNSENINTSFRLNTKQVINKKTVFSANGLFTNSISTTRSINEEPIKFEDIFLRLENYNFLIDNDYLNSELSTVESFDASEIDQIPLAPALSYYGKFEISKRSSLFSNIDYKILNRVKSKSESPSENYIFNFNNSILFNEKTKNINFYNKISSLNSINSYKFEHNNNLNRQENSNSFVLSSDINFNFNNTIKPRLKLIHYQELYRSKKIINEDSNSISFNYNNQYSDNRLFGNDLIDNSSRVIYGIESYNKFFSKDFNFKINQSYDLKKNNHFSKEINQSSNFSDYALEMSSSIDYMNFRVDIRVDEKSFSKKEMNYNFNINKPINFSLNYNETSKSAYKKVSNDTKSLNLLISKKINENIDVSYTSNLDLKNNYSPYTDSLKISLYDECSRLDLTYNNTRYSDNYNTTPEQKIGITFSMDYLGFFGYEQKTNLFFQEAGNFNYGL